jgi:hypothetical protein
MSEKDLARALLKLGAVELSSPPGSREQTQKVLARDRRRVKILAALAGFFWVASAAVLYRFLFDFLGILNVRAILNPGAVDPKITPVYQFLLALAGSIEALIFALLFSMILMFVSRRAALRQINASLIEISEKLKRLEHPIDPGRAEPGGAQPTKS